MPSDASKPKAMIFDHLVDAPPEQIRHFSAAARAMRADPRWREVPEWTEPSPVTGEIVR